MGRTLFFVIAAISMFVSTAFSKPLDAKVWKFTHLAPQTFLFENQKAKTTVLLTVSPTSMSDEQAQKYVLSPEFLKDAKLSRSGSILASEDEPREGGSGIPDLFGSVSASREEVEKTWVGVIETDFGVEGRSALMSERLWVRDGLLFHMLIGSQGTLTPSSESHQKIFAEFQADLGFGSEKTASLFDLVFDRAYAGEVARTHKAPPNKPNTRQQNVGPRKPRPRGKSECAKLVDEEGVEPSRVRQSKAADGSVEFGPPNLYLGADLSACGDAAQKVYTDMKESVLGTVNALSEWNEKQNRIAAADMAKYTKQLSCDKLLEVDKGKSDESWGASFLRNLKNSQSRVAYSKCLESAGNRVNGAMIERTAVAARDKAVEATRTAAAATSKYLESDGPLRTAKAFASFMSNPIGNTATALYRYVDSQIKGFRCLTNAEQTAVVCKFLTEKVNELAVGVATAGAGVVAVRGLKAANAIAQRLEAATKAVKGAKGAQKLEAAKEAAASAGKAAAEKAEKAVVANAEKAVVTRAEGELRTADKVRERAEARRAGKEAAAKYGNRNGANLTPEQRARQAEQMIGRKLSKDEQDVLQAAHEIGEGRGYRPEGTHPDVEMEGVLRKRDLRAKERYMLGDNPKGIVLDQRVVSINMRTGNTGDEIKKAVAPNNASKKPAQRVSRRADQSPAEALKDANRYTKEWESDLKKLEDPNLTQLDLATQGVTVRAADITRMRIRSIDTNELEKASTFTDNPNHVQMFRYATHSGSATASEAGEVMAQMVRTVPVEERAHYFDTIKGVIEQQTRNGLSDFDKTVDYGRFGENLKDTVNAMYRDLKNNPPEGITPAQLGELKREADLIVFRAQEAAKKKASAPAEGNGLTPLKMIIKRGN